MTRLILASKNEHKIREIADMLGKSRHAKLRAVEVLGIGQAGEALGEAPPEVEETEDSFVGNAVLKADGFARWLRDKGVSPYDIVLADDSGLCVDAFDGAPGVYSARFAGPEATDADNNAKLVAQLQARGLEGSPAGYVCMLAMRSVGTRPFDFTIPESTTLFIRGNCLCIEGTCRGEVRIARQGEGGFGYDPHFWIEDGARTFADLEPDQKARRSHRGVAVRRLLSELPLLL